MNTLTPTQKRRALMWIKALRSGEYKQTRKTLQDEYGYCCLGVLCKISRQPLDLKIAGLLNGGDLNSQPCVENWALGIHTWSVLKQINVASLNDSGNPGMAYNDLEPFTFDEIADVIQAVLIERVLG